MVPEALSYLKSPAIRYTVRIMSGCRDEIDRQIEVYAATVTGDDPLSRVSDRVWSDRYRIVQWLDTIDDDAPFKMEVYGLLQLLDQLSQRDVTPVARPGKYMVEVPLDWSRLPEKLHYLTEDAERHRGHWDVEAAIGKLSQSEKQELLALRASIYAAGHDRLIRKWDLPQSGSNAATAAIWGLVHMLDCLFDALEDEEGSWDADADGDDDEEGDDYQDFVEPEQRQIDPWLQPYDPAGLPDPIDEIEALADLACAGTKRSADALLVLGNCCADDAAEARRLVRCLLRVVGMESAAREQIEPIWWIICDLVSEYELIKDAGLSAALEDENAEFDLDAMRRTARQLLAVM